MSLKFSQNFSVTRKVPELIAPARPTPREVKLLSDIDDQESLRFHVPLIFFYKNNPSPAMKGKDPVNVIREAISKALVFYYPLAGRLKEGDNRKLMVDCNGEGILFIEADADFKLEQLRDEQSPSSYSDEVLYNVPGSDGILGCPVLLIQVTRLKCGGFIFALRLNHTMCDGAGLGQFLKTICDMARGKNSPSVFPVWQRELLNARNPPKVTCPHHEYEEEKYNPDTNLNDMDNRLFFFGPKEIRSLRNQLPHHLKTCSTYELCTAFAWKCRTIALNLEPGEIVRISCIVNARGKNYNMHLPSGYYGNTFAFPAECSKAEDLCRNPLGYAVELVKKAKDKMNEEYLRSTADLMVIKGRQLKYPTRGNFIVSDITHVGFGEVDFGWGKPVYAGTLGAVSLISFLMKYQNKNGESGIFVPMCLPMLAMKRFEEELKRTMQEFMEDLCNIKQQTEIFCKL